MGEGSYNVLKGSTVAYGEATNKTGYNYKWENIVTYHNTFNKDHDLTVTGVTSWNYNQSEEYYVYGENPATNDMLWYALQNADNKKLNSKYLMSKGMGFIVVSTTHTKVNTCFLLPVVMKRIPVCRKTIDGIYSRQFL